MSLELKSIKLSNFLSHKNTEINFSKEEHLLLEGVSGSGKSSIVDALIWCLYNKGRSSNISMIKKGEKKAAVTLLLKKDGTEYTIERSVTDKNKHEIAAYKNEELIKIKGIKEYQDYIEKEIIGSSYLLFINSIVYPQDNTESFVKQTSTKRKDIMMEMINVEELEEYGKKATFAYQSNSIDMAIIGSEMEEKEQINKNLLTRIEEIPILDKDNAKFSVGIKSLQEKLEEKNNLLHQFELSKVNVEGKKKEFDILNENIISNNNKVDKFKEEIKKLQNFDVKGFEEKTKELPKWKEVLSHLESNQFLAIDWNNKMIKLISEKPVDFDYQKKIDELNERIVLLLSEDIQQCPEISKICPILEDQRIKSIDSLKKELGDLKSRFNAYNDELTKFSENVQKLGDKPEVDEKEIFRIKSLIEELEVYQKQIDSQKERDKMIAQYQEEIRDCQSKNASLLNQTMSLSEEIKKLMLTGNINESEVNSDIKNIKSELDTLKYNKEIVFTKLVEAKESAKLFDGNKKKIEEIREQNKKMIDDNECLELVREAFGNNGIRNLIIDYVIPELEDKINEILNKLSDFRVKLETVKNGIGKDIVLEGLFINIINGQGEEFAYENFSGGEKIKITMAITEGLASIQKIGFRVMDEAIIGLDEYSTDNFMEVLISLQERFSQFICISHIPQIKNLFDNKILIINKNGTSQII